MPARITSLLPVLCLLASNALAQEVKAPSLSPDGETEADSTEASTPQDDPSAEQITPPEERLTSSSEVFDASTLPTTDAAMLADAPRSVVVRGGASLGNYEAGYLYYLSNHLRVLRKVYPSNSPLLDGRDYQPFDVVTGASAGALNTLLSTISACKKPQLNPEESIYYTSWIPLHAYPGEGDPDPTYGLYDPELVSRYGLFTRRPFEAAIDSLLEYYNEQESWIEQDCEVDMGMVVSRVQEREVPLQNTEKTVTAARQTEKVVVRFKKPEGGEPVLLPRPPLTPDGNLSPSASLYLHLGLNGRDEPIEFSAIAQALKASSGFPLAFSPVKIPHQEYTIDGSLVQNKRTEEALFIDGGLLENLPVMLALRIGNWRSWEQGREYTPRNLLLLDPNVESWSPYEAPYTPPDDTEPPPDTIDLAIETAVSYFDAAGYSELLEAIASSPGLAYSPSVASNPEGVRNRLYIPQRDAPTASVWLYAFMGFFEEDFRRFDFYLGMNEARSGMSDLLLDNNAPIINDPDLAFESTIFTCFTDYSVASQDFSTPVPTDQTPASCLKMVEEGPRLEDGTPRDANLLGLLRASHQYRSWTQTEGYVEDERQRLNQWIDLLISNDYQFQTFTDVENADSIRKQIREWLRVGLRKMSREQGPTKLAMSTLGDLGANTFYYSPPRYLFNVGVLADWGVEGGVGFGLNRWLRITPQLRFTRIGRRFFDEQGNLYHGMTFAPVLRLEGTPMKSALFQVEPTLGYYADIAFTFSGDYVGTRHVPFIGVNLVGLERLYASLDFGYVVATFPGAGFNQQPYQSLIDSFSIHLSFGVRFPR